MHSLLTMLDVFTGNAQPIKIVIAKAIVPSEVLAFPAAAFIEIFKDKPHAIVRIAQVVAVRLIRVTFLALNSYLGSTSELLDSVSVFILLLLSVCLSV